MTKGNLINKLDIEKICNQFEDADTLKADFFEANEIITNKYLYFHEHFKKTVAFTFYAKLLASTTIAKHRSLRKLWKKEAWEVDKLLGFSKNYPRVSSDNTMKNPTKRNLTILTQIAETLDSKLGEFKTHWEDVPINYRIDVRKHLIDSFELFGYNVEDLKKDATSNDLSIIKQESKEQESVVKVSINGETVFMHENATMLEFIKEIKMKTGHQVVVTKVIETEVEL